MKSHKKNAKKKHKKSVDTQAEYYYPLKTATEKDSEVKKVKNGYSLRKRTRGMKKKYTEPSEDEFDSEEEYSPEKKVSYRHLLFRIKRMQQKQIQRTKLSAQRTKE